MTIINKNNILALLNKTKQPNKEILAPILAKSKRLEKLSLIETAYLLNCEDRALKDEIYKTALAIKEKIYGNRIVIFAPLYISNYCYNNCLYCAFRSENKVMQRHALNKEQIQSEVKALLKQGHKRILLVSGEAYPPQKGLDFIFDAIQTIYAVDYKGHRIRRVNVNIAPLALEEFKKLKAQHIGTYQLFQETYDQDVYKKIHTTGPKADYDYRLKTINRALEAGIDDVGLGVLYGLADWRFETLALFKHIAYLEQRYNLGPHTISIPRMEKAQGSKLADAPPHQVSDEDIKLITAIIRLAVPYTGIILSTREKPSIRKELLQLGVSQISAGSKTQPGGYSSKSETTLNSTAQFSLGDHRSLDEVIYDLLKADFIPSFCTACYRLGRTGVDFMEYAKPGDIKKVCTPNALLTFQEYLVKFARKKTRALGDKKLDIWLKDLPTKSFQEKIREKLERIRSGGLDEYM